MIRRIALTSLLMASATLLPAAITVQQEGTPTVNVDGSTTWRVTVVSDDPNEIIYGVDASFDGPIGQIRGGPITTSPFREVSFWFIEIIGFDISEDSHFMFSSTALSPPALGVVDTETRLAAAITNLPHATGGDGLTIPLAQIVKLDHDIVHYSLDIDVRTPDFQRVRLASLSGVIGVPEPSSLALAGLASGLLARRRFGGKPRC
ncbi:MAG: PEP-CTERM sorting domain-containing protein [Planctomycetales bacterium]|nr:PEP-CTERM sorting domain-containing protein [Planctomycetales bacterium]